MSRESTKAKRKVVRKSADVVISTSHQVGDQPKVDHTARTKVDGLPPDPAYVTVGGGLTKSIGNYESVKVNVSISVPCRVTDKSIRKAHRYCSDLVAELLEEELERAMED